MLAGFGFSPPEGNCRRLPLSSRVWAHAPELQGSILNFLNKMSLTLGEDQMQDDKWKEVLKKGGGPSLVGQGQTSHLQTFCEYQDRGVFIIR